MNPPPSLGGCHCGDNNGDMVIIMATIVMTGDNGNSTCVGAGCNAHLQQQ